MARKRGPGIYNWLSPDTASARPELAKYSVKTPSGVTLTILKPVITIPEPVMIRLNSHNKVLQVPDRAIRISRKEPGA